MPVENTPVSETPETTSPAAAPPDADFHQDAFSQALHASKETPAASAATPAAQVQPEASPPAVPAAVAQPNFRELAKQSGLQADRFKTDQELFEAMLKERQQLSQYANIGRQYAPHLSEFDKFLQSQQQQPAPAVKEQPADPNAFDIKKHFSEAWKAPAWDSKWNFYVEKGWAVQDETGEFVAAPGRELLVGPHLAAMNESQDGARKSVADLFYRRNPVEAFYEGVKAPLLHEMRELIRAERGQDRSQQQQQNELQSFEEQHRAILYTKDLAGQEVLSPAGEKLVNYAQTLAVRGIPEHEALQLAAEMTGFGAQAGGAPAQQVVPPTPAQVSQQKQESFIDNARKRASHAPSASAYSPTNTPNAPFITDESELDSMFSNALAQS